MENHLRQLRSWNECSKFSIQTPQPQSLLLGIDAKIYNHIRCYKVRKKERDSLSRVTFQDISHLNKK